jgi:hypothetical protein
MVAPRIFIAAPLVRRIPNRAKEDLRNLVLPLYARLDALGARRRDEPVDQPRPRRIHPADLGNVDDQRAETIARGNGAHRLVDESHPARRPVAGKPANELAPFLVHIDTRIEVRRRAITSAVASACFRLSVDLHDESS